MDKSINIQGKNEFFIDFNTLEGDGTEDSKLKVKIPFTQEDKDRLNTLNFTALTSVATDSTIDGDGQTKSPLKVALPIAALDYRMKALEEKTSDLQVNADYVNWRDALPAERGEIYIKEIDRPNDGSDLPTPTLDNEEKSTPNDKWGKNLPTTTLVNKIRYLFVRIPEGEKATKYGIKFRGTKKESSPFTLPLTSFIISDKSNEWVYYRSPRSLVLDRDYTLILQTQKRDVTERSIFGGKLSANTVLDLIQEKIEFDTNTINSRPSSTNPGSKWFIGIKNPLTANSLGPGVVKEENIFNEGVTLEKLAEAVTNRLLPETKGNVNDVLQVVDDNDGSSSIEWASPRSDWGGWTMLKQTDKLVSANGQTVGFELDKTKYLLMVMNWRSNQVPTGNVFPLSFLGVLPRDIHLQENGGASFIYKTRLTGEDNQILLMKSTELDQNTYPRTLRVYQQ